MPREWTDDPDRDEFEDGGDRNDPLDSDMGPDKEDEDESLVPCPECGKPVSDLADRCPFCGSFIMPMSDRRALRTPWVRISTVALLLLFFAGVAAMLMRGFGKR